MVAHPSQEPGKGADRLDALTGMRGLASLMVVGYHAVGFYWLWQLESGRATDAFGHPLSAWGLGAGWLGVDLFFVLSGFLLARPLLRKAGRMTGPEYRAFAAKRVLRIAPPYYVALALAYALVGWSGHPLFHFTTKGVLLHLVYLHTFFEAHAFGILSVAWTLGLELQFYLLLPLILIPFRRYGPGVALPCLAIAATYLFWAHDPGDFLDNRFRTSQFPAYLGHFAVGIAAAQLVQRGWRPKVQPDLALAGAFAVLVVAPAWLTGYPTRLGPVDVPYLVHPMAAAFFALLMVLATQPESLLGRALALRPMMWVGEASYSLYLVHYSVAGAFIVTRPAWAFTSLGWFAVILTMASLLAAATFYVLVERPSLQLKEAVARRLGGIPRPRGLDPAP